MNHGYNLLSTYTVLSDSLSFLMQAFCFFFCVVTGLSIEEKQ